MTFAGRTTRQRFGWRAMPRGACVIPYRGKRSVVWRVKYHAGDRQVMETPGSENGGAADCASVLRAYRGLEARAEDAERPWYAAARRMTTVALSTGLRRGELLGLRWQDVELLERRLHVRQAFVRNEITTPKGRAGRRVVPLGDVAAAALEEQFADSLHRAPASIVFCHPALGTPLDASKLTKYARKALDRAG